MEAKDHIKVIGARIQAIRGRLDALEAEKRDLLIRLDEAEGISTATGAGCAVREQTDGWPIVEVVLPNLRRKRRNKGKNGRTSTTSLIVDLVAEFPGSLKPPVIADELANKITSRSKTPRRIILNSIINLVHNGELLKSSDGLLSLNETAEPPSSMEGGI